MREEIIGLARNFCVSAGAGAGKTSCLVQTYLGLLAGGPSRAPLKPEQIVAITFTDKAAQEMRIRVVREVAGRAGQGSQIGGVDWAGLLSRVEWAPISTIHSFCAALLREFGAFLGLDPEFAVLEAREFASIRQQVIAEVLRRHLQGRDERLARLLRGLGLAGRGSLPELLARLQGELATQGLSASQAALATAQAHEQAQVGAPGLPAELDEVVGQLAGFLADAKPGAKATYLNNIQKIKDVWRLLYKPLEENSLDSSLLERLKELLGGNWGKAKELKDQAQDMVARLLDLAALPAAAALGQDLLGLAQEVEQELDIELRRRAALSFDHLLLLALELLRGHPAVLAELRRRYGALLVDEFQDVNPVQGRMVYLLAGLETPDGQPAAPAPDAPLVLLVGDRKQSIYAFRGADVGVFGQTLRRFEDGWGQVAFLGENFRSRPELIAFYNRVFPQIFGQAAAPQAALGLYVDFRPDDQQVAGCGQPGQGPALGVLDCRDLGGEGTSLAAWRQTEARALARHLRTLQDQGWPGGDMAILLRRLIQVEVYERALAAEGLDFYTVGGRGFYQCQEVGDLLMALRALLDPADGLALAGFLRSPLIGLNDEALLALAFDEGGQTRPLAQALHQVAGLPGWLGPRQQERWRRARAWLLELRPLARRYTPAELLECLVEASDLLPMWLGTGSGEQKAANLRKLIESARDPRLAGTGVEEFTQRLAELMAEEPSDGQAPLMGEEAPVIRLMSIHQAKGLEFPLVALADLAFRPRANAPLLAPGGVLALKGPDPHGGPERATPLTKALLERQRAVEEAEAARLFYVALTRARERLVFCLHGAKRGDQGYWGRWLEDFVLPDPETQLLSATGLAGFEPAPAPAEAPPHGPELAERARGLVGRSLERGPAPVALVSESVSALEDWLTCPRRYIFSRRLMLDSAWLAPGGGQGGAGRPNAAALGNAVHRLLELADLSQGPEGLAATVAGLDLEPELAIWAAELAAGWWDFGLPQLLAQAGPGRLSREQGFCLYLPAQDGGPALEVIGEFDLLVRPEQGPVILVDYKVSAEVEPEKYRAQMGIYALALWHGQGEQGPLPRVFLYYLSRGGGRLLELPMQAGELASWRLRLRLAARDIASLPAHLNPLDLPPATDCPAAHCILSKADLCLI